MKKNIFGKKIGFIGVGNMAEAIVLGLIKSGFKAAKITVSDVNAGRLAYFSKKYGVAACSENLTTVKNSDIIVLAVKPHQVDEVLSQAGPAFDKKKLLISIAAGTRTKKIEKYLNGSPVVRSMPNTPALVGEGAFAICAGKRSSKKDMADAESLLGTCGIVVRVAEKDMDAVTAVSGSGPAYLFYAAEIMRNTAEKMGIDKNSARILVNQTLKGASKMLAESQYGPEQLRTNVTSKGGTTQAAFDVIMKNKLGGIFEKAMLAAMKRSAELSKK